MPLTRARIPLAVLALLLLAGCQTMPGDPSVSGEVSVEGENARVDVVFGDHERRRIREYFASGRNLPPGLAKKQKLPPGLAKQVKRNGRLPPGLEGRPLPAELERQLRDLPESYVRVRVGMDVVLMNTDTRVVVDVIEDVGGE